MLVLPVPVAADERGDARLQLDLEAGVGAEVVEREVGDVQAARGSRRATCRPSVVVGRGVDVGGGRRPTGLDGVAAEPVAHRRDRLHRRAVVLARAEPGEQRGGDDVHRYGVVDRGLHRPATLAGVLGVPADLLEVGVLLERRDQQVEQPGPDHGALAPGVEDLGHVVDQVDLLGAAPSPRRRPASWRTRCRCEPSWRSARRPASCRRARCRPRPRGLSASKAGHAPWRRPRRTRRTSARSRSPGPRPRRRRRSRRTRCPSSPRARR